MLCINRGLIDVGFFLKCLLWIDSLDLLFPPLILISRVLNAASCILLSFSDTFQLKYLLAISYVPVDSVQHPVGFTMHVVNPESVDLS